MEKTRIVILTLALFVFAGCATVPKETTTPSRRESYLGMSRAELENELGLPDQVSYENGDEVFTYWVDEGGLLGHVKYVITLVDGKVAQFMKGPTSSRFKADLNEQDLHNLEMLDKANRPGATVPQKKGSNALP